MRLFILILVLLPAAALAQETIKSEQADFKITQVADGLDYPWSIAFLPGGDYLVTEREGHLLRVKPDGTKTEITGIPTVHSGGQAGLFDVVLGPDFVADKGYIYWAYAAGSAAENNTEVARGIFDAKTNKLSDVKVIFKAMPKVSGDNHYGGRLAFAPDGSLYISLGERFNHSKQAQNLKSHLGKIIRIMPDGTIPLAGNPFTHKLGAWKEIYSYGHRNVQGLAIQPATGKVWAHEHGPKGGDEVNILKEGANYGWPMVTFGVDYSGEKISEKSEAPGIVPPVVHWTPSIAPSGMAFYSGRAFPAWRGDLFVGALAGTQLRRLEINGDKVTAQEILLEDMGSRIRDVRSGPDGALYVLTDEAGGRILKLEPSQSPAR